MRKRGLLAAAGRPTDRARRAPQCSCKTQPLPWARFEFFFFFFCSIYKYKHADSINTSGLNLMLLHINYFQKGHPNIDQTRDSSTSCAQKRVCMFKSEMCTRSNTRSTLLMEHPGLICLAWLVVLECNSIIVNVNSGLLPRSHSFGGLEKLIFLKS